MQVLQMIDSLDELQVRLAGKLINKLEAAEAQITALRRNIYALERENGRLNEMLDAMREHHNKHCQCGGII
jgi:predicted nuclease with TOPRIM domain